MGRFNVRLNDGKRDYYLLWSTVVDAPITYGLTLDEMRELVKEENGRAGLEQFEETLKHWPEGDEIPWYGIRHRQTFDDLILLNRAGIDETCLTREQIIAVYCHQTGEQRGKEHSEEDDE